MLYELMKNAARAVVEAHHPSKQQQHLSSAASPGAGPSSSAASSTAAGAYDPLGLPPINGRICSASPHSALLGAPPWLTIFISDQGGGVPPKLLKHIFSYGFSTVGMDGGELARWLRGPSKGGGREKAGPLHAQRQRGRQQGGEDGGAFLTWEAEDDHGGASAPRREAWEGLGENGDAEDEQPASWPASSRGGGRGVNEGMPALGGAIWPPLGTQAAGGGGGSHASDGELAGALMGAAGGGPLGSSNTSSPLVPPGQGQYRMAGLGFGLPMSRLYARYFGGDLSLKVVPTYGTNAYLTLRRHPLLPQDKGDAS